MPANYKSELVAVFGQPVAENPTGVMQEAAFKAAGLDWRYLTIEVAPDPKQLTERANDDVEPSSRRAARGAREV